MDIQQRFRQDTAKPILATSPLPYVIWSTDLSVIIGELRKVQPAQFIEPLISQCKNWGREESNFTASSLDTTALSISRLVRTRPSLIVGVTLEPTLYNNLFNVRLWSKKRS